MEIDNALLEEVNKELRDNNVAHRTRPWEAMGIISERLDIVISLPSKEADFIFNWFEENGKPGNQIQGHYHQGAYFYDAEFWSVSIPLIYGNVEINCLDALHEMPTSIKSSLTNDKGLFWDYVVFWTDCIDFGYAYGDLCDSKDHNTFGIQLLKAGYEELASATSLMLEHQPNGRAIMNSRMASEILMKSFICLKRGLTEKEAKKLGHDLKSLLKELIKCSGYTTLDGMYGLISVFPEIHKRYNEQAAPKIDIFNAYAFAQSIGALLAREFTDRNTLAKIKSSNN